MNNTKKALVLMSCIILLLGMLSGCMSKSNNAPAATTTAQASSAATAATTASAATTTATTTANATTAASTTTTPAETPTQPASKSGEPIVFIFAGPNNLTQWNPLNENKTNNNMINRLIYNALVNPYGADDNITISPELAESWSVSDDGMVWTFKLRNDVKFHNGEAFDSSSVVATIQYILDTPTLTAASFWTQLDSVEAVDQFTVDFKLKAPWSAIMTTLVDTPILPAKAYAEKGEALFEFNETNRPIGTGPWVADKWTPGQDAEFVRNEDYWGWGDNKSNVDRIIYRPAIEDTTRVSGIQAGDLDMIDAVPIEMAERLKSASGITVQEIYGTAIVHLGFRTVESDDGKYRVFKDVKARQAVSHAIDRALLVSSIAGGGNPSDWPCPYTVMGYDSSRAKVPEYSVEMATQLLAETDYAGQTISFIVPNGVFARSKEIAQAILAMLTEAGFSVNMELMENAAFQERRASADYDLYLQRYPYPCGDPDSVVVTRWLNDAHKSGYVNKDLNALIESQRSETDPDKRVQKLKDMFALQWEVLAPHAALYQQITTVAYKSGVTGLYMRPDNVFDYSRVSKN